MKNLLWVVLAVVILGGGYMLFTGKSVTDVVDTVSETANEVDAPAALESASEAAGEAVEAATDAVTETATEAADAVADTAAEAVDAATETATEAADAASEAASAAAETASEAADAATTAADTAVETATEAADAATETVTETVQDGVAATQEAAQDTVEAVTATPEPLAADAAPDALTMDGFSMDKARELIEGTDLGAMQKTLLVQTINKAQDNPELLKSALEAARSALGY